MNIKQESKNLFKEQVTCHKKSLHHSFSYAVKGIARVFCTERSFRIQLLLAALAFVAGFLFHISRTEWIFILLVSFLVLSLEMINTAFELIIDLVTEEYKIIAEHINVSEIMKLEQEILL